MQVLDWFSVTFDDTTVVLRAHPSGQEPWTQQFTWDSVIRICLKAEVCPLCVFAPLCLRDSSVRTP